MMTAQYKVLYRYSREESIRCQIDHYILRNGISYTSGDNSLTENRQELNTTVSSGISTDKQELLLNKSDRCCKESVTAIKFTNTI
jgi:hypothetical protein